nr:ACT domain-containing protein [uncultured marine group II/III euryarchaeote KM3_177_C07]AIF06393.1 ACT domain-containing protein [uncultured marine group II/III euryarchaeote KM3_191_F05]
MLKNSPGQMAAVGDALAEAGVNIQALSVVDASDHAVMRLVTSDWAATRTALEEMGHDTLVTEVLAIELPHKKGALAEASTKLAAAGINIDYIYGSAAGRKSILVARVSNLKAALKALG